MKVKDQHKKIKTYRDLSQEEIDLMNAIKDKSAELGELLGMVQAHQQKQLTLIHGGEETDEKPVINEHQVTESSRCVHIAAEKLQTGMMWLSRAVALPDGF